MDTNVIVSGLRAPGGASAEILRLARRGNFKLLASVPLFVEYEAVALRPENVKASGLTRKEILQVLDAVASFVEPVHIYFLWRPLLRDPKDDLVLETAVNGNAAALVTFNTRHFMEECEAFGIKTLLPSEALKRL